VLDAHCCRRRLEWIYVHFLLRIRQLQGHFNTHIVSTGVNYQWPANSPASKLQKFTFKTLHNGADKVMVKHVLKQMSYCISSHLPGHKN